MDLFCSRWKLVTFLFGTLSQPYQISLYRGLTPKGQKQKIFQRPCCREPEEVWRETCFIWWRRIFLLSDHLPGRHYLEPISFVLRFPAETSSKGLGSMSQRPLCQPQDFVHGTAWPPLRSASFCFENWSPAWSPKWPLFHFFPKHFLIRSIYV